MKRIAIVGFFLQLTFMLMAQPQKDPTRAVIYSAVIPGGGQIYNHAYVKAGVVIGVQAYFLGSLLWHDSKANDYKVLSESTTDAYYQQLYKTKRKEYQELRTSDFWWMGITAALSVLDAYVDAHLSNFESEKDKLHIRFEGETLLLEHRF